MIATLRRTAALALLVAVPAGCIHRAPPSDGGASDSVRIVLFGDSNTDAGWKGTEPRAVVRSYVSDGKHARHTCGVWASVETIAASRQNKALGVKPHCVE